jgi:hypothetical protein
MKTKNKSAKASKPEQKKRSERNTVVKVEKFKGSKTFAIHDQDRIDNDEDRTYIIGFGVTKAKLLLKHLAELKAYVEKYGGASEEEEED